MLRIKKYIKDWLVLVAVISILVIIVILGFYFSQAYGNFARKQTDWSEFGSLLGAITGLIAFVGVLFTLRQNKQQSLDNEDRSVFFELLKIFISYRDSLRVKRINWKYVKEKCDWDITSCDEFCTPEETYHQVYIELYHIFYLEIRRSIPEYFSKEEFSKRIIPENVPREQWSMTYGHLTAAIDNTYIEYNWNKYGHPITTFPVQLNAYDHLCFNAIKIYIEQDNFKPIAEACAKAANLCFGRYKNQLGTYFRNAYYILEMAAEFHSPKKYSKIFRAQLSKNELVLLFFNSFGSLSTSKTRELYLSADLFNNLELKDIRLKVGVNDGSVSRKDMDFSPFSFPMVGKDEYVSRDFLKKIYDSID